MARVAARQVDHPDPVEQVHEPLVHRRGPLAHVDLDHLRIESRVVAVGEVEPTADAAIALGARGGRQDGDPPSPPVEQVGVDLGHGRQELAAADQGQRSGGGGRHVRHGTRVCQVVGVGTSTPDAPHRRIPDPRSDTRVGGLASPS
ncbi:hypothetical protein DVS28_a3707 [Euzebya pacifica]|uniref:Uncharacterized protein n=1 Tax=Euzebya pacifica TaxID=1608957 RepID=A0A346Y1N3_9ACTN|nr:hypothetical protein DVS28_a3707 [Euzebya pacifica]